MRKAKAEGIVQADLLERRDDPRVGGIEPMDLQRLLEDVSYQKLDFPDRPTIAREEPMTLQRLDAEFRNRNNFV